MNEKKGSSTRDEQYDTTRLAGATPTVVDIYHVPLHADLEAHGQFSALRTRYRRERGRLTTLVDLPVVPERHLQPDFVH